MKTLRLLSVALLLAIAGTSTAQDLDAAALIRRVEDSLRGETSMIKMVMTTTTPRWTRSLAFRTWDDSAQKRSFTRILEPKKDRGTGFLKLGTTLWTYLPRVERTTRMPPSMLLQSWMGSEFTNDDVVRQSSMADDYTAEFLGDEDCGGVTCVGIRLTPLESAAVVWGRIDASVEKDGLAPRTFMYYDEPQPNEFEVIRKLHFSDIRPVQGRSFPHHWEMEPLEKPGHRTVIVVEEVEFDLPLSDDLFTKANLKRKEGVR